MPAPDDLSDTGRELLARSAAIGAEIAAPAADAVDRDARFPKEAIDALRADGLLGALVPTTYGGAGASFTDVAAICTELGRHCSNTAMVFAMHQIQVACIVRHGQGLPHFDDLLRELAVNGRLMASATTEAGVGGDVRSSICAVVRDGDRFTLDKNASVISYGEYADDVLATARAHPDASASDQVIVHVPTDSSALEPNGVWDTIGMRGTCSIGFQLRASGNVDQILPTPYSEISSRTMLPVSHITWASLWLGIATAAMDKARAFVRAAARKTPGTLPPSATHLAEAYAELEKIRAAVDAAIREFEATKDDPDAGTSIGTAIRMNNLKLSVSVDAAAVVGSALSICGIAGFRNDTPYSLGRQLRDSLSAPLMVHNDRIVGHNASLLCLLKDG